MDQARSVLIKWRGAGILHNLQRCAVFIAAFTSEKKMKEDNQKKYIPQLAIDTKFFHCTFANLSTM
jgi:hypothetical protein